MEREAVQARREQRVALKKALQWKRTRREALVSLALIICGRGTPLDWMLVRIVMYTYILWIGYLISMHVLRPLLGPQIAVGFISWLCRIL